MHICNSVSNNFHSHATSTKHILTFAPTNILTCCAFAIIYVAKHDTSDNMQHAKIIRHPHKHLYAIAALSGYILKADRPHYCELVCYPPLIFRIFAKYSGFSSRSSCFTDSVRLTHLFVNTFIVIALTINMWHVGFITTRHFRGLLWSNTQLTAWITMRTFTKFDNIVIRYSTLIKNSSLFSVQ